MVKIKAQSDGDETHVSVSVEGTGEDILNESLAAIEGLMGNLKEQSVILHSMALKVMSDDPKILLGKTTGESGAKFEQIRIKEGVN